MEEIMGGLSFIDVLCEELSEAAQRRGIRINECYESGGEVHVSFPGIREAEEFVRLAVPVEDRGPGSLYDRCTSSCVSLVAIATEHGDGEVSELTDDERNAVAQAIDTGWTWQVHPDVQDAWVGWHVAVDMSPADAQTVIAHLNVGA